MWLTREALNDDGDEEEEEEECSDYMDSDDSESESSDDGEGRMKEFAQLMQYSKVKYLRNQQEFWTFSSFQAMALRACKREHQDSARF